MQRSLLMSARTTSMLGYLEQSDGSFRLQAAEFGTTTLQVSEKKSGFLAPKRHRMKHLDFDLLLVRDQGSELQILSPRPFISCPFRRHR